MPHTFIFKYSYLFKHVIFFQFVTQSKYAHVYQFLLIKLEIYSNGRHVYICSNEKLFLKILHDIFKLTH